MSYIKKEPLCAWLSNMCVSENIIKAIENDSRFPSADVVEVVRCKDCKHCFHYIIPNYERYECEYYGTSDEVVDYVQPTHYCSYGERRVNND